MHNAPLLPKLGHRLAAIKQAIRTDYDHIWDCCCDHGQLGMHMLYDELAPNIHFVDIVPALVASVQSKLELHFPTDPTHSQAHQWHTHCLDAATLPIAETTIGAKHLVIIAGVGGDLCTSLITKLHGLYPTANIEFLVCPVRHLYTLRSTLNDKKFQVLHESLVEENKRIYEVILTRSPSESKDTWPLIHPLGEQIWRDSSVERRSTENHDFEALKPHKHTLIQQYLSQQISHYARKSGSDSAKNKAILTQLRSLQAHITST